MGGRPGSHPTPWKLEARRGKLVHTHMQSHCKELQTQKESPHYYNGSEYKYKVTSAKLLC